MECCLYCAVAVSEYCAEAVAEHIISAMTVVKNSFFISIVYLWQVAGTNIAITITHNAPQPGNLDCTGEALLVYKTVEIAKFARLFTKFVIWTQRKQQKQPHRLHQQQHRQQKQPRKQQKQPHRLHQQQHRQQKQPRKQQKQPHRQQVKQAQHRPRSGW